MPVARRCQRSARRAMRCPTIHRAGTARLGAEKRSDAAACDAHQRASRHVNVKPATVDAGSMDLPGNMDELELDALGIGEEHRVVAGDVLGIFAWGIENAPAEGLDLARQGVDLLPALGAERDLAQSDS